MCGRTACTLSKDRLQQACCVFDPGSNNFKQIDWEESQNGGKTYTPSYNLCPTDVSPVIVLKSAQRVLKPMLWGMIPPWHQGKFNDHRLSTNNCRIEGILDSKLYRESMNVGKRCVVVCDGFYEWQTTKGKTKQPYFIYAPQKDGIEIDKPASWNLAWSESSGWHGPKLLSMAALYNVWMSPEGDQFYSYSIVTMESNEKFTWLHHRVPAVLDTDEDIDKWLKLGTAPNEVLQNLNADCSISWHPVSSRVNNSRDKSLGLNSAVKLGEQKMSKSANMMANWLKRKSDEKDVSSEKKPKTD